MKTDAFEITNLVLNAMPGTMKEIAESTGFHLSTVEKYIKILRADGAQGCHISGHKSNSGNPRYPAHIYSAGPGEDVTYVKFSKWKAPLTPEEKEKRNAYYRAYRANGYKRPDTGKGDPEQDEAKFEAERLERVRQEAHQAVEVALSKQNSPFGPLFN